MKKVNRCIKKTRKQKKLDIQAKDNIRMSDDQTNRDKDKVEHQINRFAFFKKIYNIMEKSEPIFRFIEVICIGLVSFFVSIKANSIAKTANEISKAQLELSRKEFEPIFEIHRQTTSNSEGDENANSEIIVDVVSGHVKNVIIDTETIVTVNYFQEDRLFQSVDINIYDYYFAQNKNSASSGIISVLYTENNKKKYWQAYTSFLNDDLYFAHSNIQLNTIIKISYENRLGDQQTLYYLIDEVRVCSISQQDGEKLYEQYSNIDKKLSIYNLSIENVKELIVQ